MTRQEFNKFVAEQVLAATFAKLNANKAFIHCVLSGGPKIYPIGKWEPISTSGIVDFATVTLQHMEEIENFDHYAMFNLSDGVFYKIPIDLIEHIRLWEGDETMA